MMIFKFFAVLENQIGPIDDKLQRVPVCIGGYQVVGRLFGAQSMASYLRFIKICADVLLSTISPAVRFGPIRPPSRLTWSWFKPYFVCDLDHSVSPKTWWNPYVLPVPFRLRSLQRVGGGWLTQRKGF